MYPRGDTILKMELAESEDFGLEEVQLIQYL